MVIIDHAFEEREARWKIKLNYPKTEILCGIKYQIGLQNDFTIGLIRLKCMLLNESIM